MAGINMRAMAPGMSRLAMALGGGGVLQDRAYQNEMGLQSKIAQAVAQMRESNAKAEQTELENEARSPEAVRRLAMTSHGIPLDEGDSVDSYLRTGRLGGKYDTQGLPGPVMPQPDWADKLGEVARSIGLTSRALAIGDKNSENIAKAGSIERGDRLSDAIIAGTQNRNTVAGAQAAAKGDALFSTDSTGSVLDRYMGTLDTSNPLAGSTINLRTQQAGKEQAAAGAQRANAAQSYAQARAADALAKQRDQATAAAGQGVRMVVGEDGEIRQEVVPGGKPAKPMPSSALKMQQEELDAIGMASAIDADLGVLEEQIDSGALPLGLVSNLINRARNEIGRSTPESRNLNTFQATLERMRNDSLRLNKGVQTEGDAQRAWNELVANIRDPEVVKQRLGEIRRLNQRAAELRRMNVEAIRSNFGQPPIDLSKYRAPPAALGAGGPAAANPTADPLGLFTQPKR